MPTFFVRCAFMILKIFVKQLILLEVLKKHLECSDYVAMRLSPLEIVVEQKISAL